MDRDYGSYLQFLAKEYNSLYIGKDSKDFYIDVSGYFASSSSIDINRNMLNEINNILSIRDVNIVIFDAEEDNSLILEFFNTIKAYDKEIMIFLMCGTKEYDKLFEIIPFVDAVISYPIDKHIFQKRLFTLLSRGYALNSIGRREIILKQESVSEDVMDKFFDIYEGSALFLADDLISVVKKLNSGDLSNQIFIDISKHLEDVATIFSKAKQTSSVVPIYIDLAHFLIDLNFEEIKPKDIIAFSYLGEILSDVSIYLMDMFVDRIFKDVYVFEYSLKSNIEFMKNKLLGKDEDESELEFF